MGILHTNILSAERAGISAADGLEHMARTLERMANDTDLCLTDRAEMLVKARKVALMAAELTQILATGAAGRLAEEAGELVPVGNTIDPEDIPF